MIIWNLDACLVFVFSKPWCWDKILHDSHISARLASKGVDCPLCPDYFFKDVCIANSCGRYYICFTARAGLFTVQCNKNSFPLWQRASLLTVHYKLGFSPKMLSISYAPVTYPSLPHPVGTGPQWTYKKWYSSHCLLMSNKLLFVSDLEISCLLSEFMKLW